ncbi:MAG TPA: hypothetical protein VFX30_02895 [bacterium]|nr:hypothetical protein [bacterium]
MFLNNLSLPLGLQSVIGGMAQRTAPALALAATLGSSGCLGDSETINPVAPSGPAALNTIATTDLVPAPDGCQYGEAIYTLEREERPYAVIVAAQTSCPAGYFIGGSCSPRFRYPGSSALSYRTPFLDDVCYGERLTMDRGIDPCQLGALVCAVSAPGDTVETTTNYGGDGEQSTSSEVVDGPDLIELALEFRCCPNP